MKILIFSLLIAFQISAAAQNSANFVPNLDTTQQANDEDPNLARTTNPDGSPRSEASVFIPGVDPNCGPCVEKYLKRGGAKLSDFGNKNLSQRAKGVFLPGSQNTSPGSGDSNTKKDANVGK